MPPDRRPIAQLARLAHLGTAVLRSTATRPPAWMKVHVCLTGGQRLALLHAGPVPRVPERAR
jgi:hypothetical protein